MPFTPFHMGAGLAVKAVADRRFSVLVFGIAQVAMDIEPLIGMITGKGDLHGITHTYMGAFFIGLVVWLLAPFICNPILCRYNREARAMRVPWLVCPEPISRTAAALGAFIGTFTHVLLDSLMHSDMQPFWPLAGHNPLLFLVNVDAVYRYCFWVGVVGSVIWIACKFLQRQRSR